jgi:chitodextrinase
MTSLVAPIAALPTFTVSWAATDNVAVTGYQVRTKQGTGAWSAPEDRTARIETFTLANGTWVFGVRATDAAGNWSAWREVTVVVDGSAPVMTSLTAPSLVTAKDGSFVATFVASDNVAVSGYAIRTRKGAAEAWSATTWQSTRTKAFGKLAAGTWYLSVSARDSAGNMSAWREIRVVVPRDDRSYRFSRGTVRLRGASEFMRTQTTTSVRGATMTVRFTGDAFYLIGTTAMSRGQMRVTIDGTAYKIDEGRYHGSRSISTHHRVLLLSKALANKAHVVVITNLATSRRPTISIDGLGWRN